MEVIQPLKVAVLGGGISGLTAAWKLSGAGHPVRLFEAGPRLGGPVRTSSAGGWLAEAGPNSFQESSPRITTVLGDLGLGGERIEASAAAKNRFVVVGGRLVALPSSPGGFIGTDLLSAGTKIRVLLEAFRSPVMRREDVSLAELVRDHFGSQLVSRIVQPFVGGIYAGDVERLSSQYAFPRLWESERRVGSLVRAAAAGARNRKRLGLSGSPALVSFRGGLQRLPDALAARIPAHSLSLNSQVTAIGPGKGARWSVRWTTPEGPHEAEFDCVAAALPAGSLASLEICGSRPLEGLAAVDYSPVSSIFLGYRREQVRHSLDGFGALIPAAEKRSILGVVFSSSLFPGRAPDGHVAMTVFAGGALRPDIAALSDGPLLDLVRSDLGSLLGAEGEPVFVQRTHWPRAIPQYNLGYGRHLEAIAECERGHPGLFFGGSVRDGISLPDCIASGADLAKRVS